MAEQKAARRKLLLMAFMFVVPVFLAYFSYFGPGGGMGLVPQGTTENGRLVSPARPTPKLDYQLSTGEAAPDLFNGKWSLVHIGNAVCDEACEKRVYATRQLRTSLHRHRLRVQRVYMATDAAQAAELQQRLEEFHPHLRITSLPEAQYAEFLNWLGEIPEADPVLMVDPLGNFLMVYGDELPLKGMFKDIKKLLKLSNIG